MIKPIHVTTLAALVLFAGACGAAAPSSTATGVSLSAASPVPTASADCGSSSFNLALLVNGSSVSLCANQVPCLLTADTKPQLLAMKVPLSAMTVFIQIDNGHLDGTSPSESGNIGDFPIAGQTGAAIIDGPSGPPGGWQTTSGTITISSISGAVPSSGIHGFILGKIDVKVGGIGDIYSDGQLTGNWMCSD